MDNEAAPKRVTEPQTKQTPGTVSVDDARKYAKPRCSTCGGGGIVWDIVNGKRYPRECECSHKRRVRANRKDARPARTTWAEYKAAKKAVPRA